MFRNKRKKSISSVDSCSEKKLEKSETQSSKANTRFELERLHKKLEKNRESARNSRKRKKIYIELLENKVKFIKKRFFINFGSGRRAKHRTTYNQKRTRI